MEGIKKNKMFVNFNKVWYYLADLMTKVIATENRLNCFKRSAFDTYSTLYGIKKPLFELCSSGLAGFYVLDCKTIIHRFESGRRLHFTTCINRASKHSWRFFFLNIGENGQIGDYSTLQDLSFGIRFVVDLPHCFR